MLTCAEWTNAITRNLALLKTSSLRQHRFGNKSVLVSTNENVVDICTLMRRQRSGTFIVERRRGLESPDADLVHILTNEQRAELT